MLRLVFLFLSFSFFTLNAQVGVGTLTPEAAMEVSSTTNGILIPRVRLTNISTAAPVVNPNGSSLPISTLVYNTGSLSLVAPGFYYWTGTAWKSLIDNSPATYVGKFIIDRLGNINIAGLGFQPKSITFTAYANVETYSLNSAGSSQNDKDNSFGNMTGYAKSELGGIVQQVIYIGGSGQSINNISRYASANNCIGLRYANQNGSSFGITSASLTTFNTDGFTLNVDSYLANENVVILFEAHKY